VKDACLLKIRRFGLIHETPVIEKHCRDTPAACGVLEKSSSISSRNRRRARARTVPMVGVCEAISYD
jgi:hypothetical protein